jgi:hypothetical protein
MSLQHAAKHLASHGRGPDTELIHMTKGEINGLQQLAMAGGGSLTINPHTGLAEAGFLSKMLPMLAGAAAMYFTGGAAAPLIGGMSNAATIGLGMGALETARTGSLQKGLMAGMGAYGGAGLAGGLLTAGAQNVAGETIAKEAAANAAAEGVTLPSNYAQMAGQTATPAQLQAAQQGMSGLDVMGKGVGSIQSGGLGAAQSAMQAAGGPSLGRAGLAAAAPVVAGMMAPQNTTPQAPTGDSKMPQRLQYNAGRTTDAQGQTVTPMPDVPSYASGMGENFGRQQNYFPTAGYQNITDEQAKQMRGYAGGGPVEAMSNANAIGANTGFPMADINKATYATPYQTPVSQNVVQGTADTGVNSMTGEQNEFARGGLSSAASHLGDYSDGGRLLKGPGDGVSDSIPATIGNKRPARLADGEFVVPARIVSELGNGSTEAGARKLYAMLDRVQAARKKSIGKNKVAKNSRADKLLPA